VSRPHEVSGPLLVKHAAGGPDSVERVRLAARAAFAAQPADLEHPLTTAAQEARCRSAGLVVGVDPHRDLHVLAVVHVLSGAVVFETMVAANSDGYAQALKLVDAHASGQRAFAVQGTGSFGAGLRASVTDLQPKRCGTHPVSV
jgi:hypothetical protein